MKRRTAFIIVGAVIATYLASKPWTVQHHADDPLPAYETRSDACPPGWAHCVTDPSDPAQLDAWNKELDSKLRDPQWRQDLVDRAGREHWDVRP